MPADAVEDVLQETFLAVWRGALGLNRWTWWAWTFHPWGQWLAPMLAMGMFTAGLWIICVYETRTGRGSTE